MHKAVVPTFVCAQEPQNKNMLTPESLKKSKYRSKLQKIEARVPLEISHVPPEVRVPQVGNCWHKAWREA